MAIQQTSANLVEELPPYIISEELAEFASQVISENNGFRDLEDLRFVYLLRTDQPLDADDEIDAIVAVTKLSPPLHAATGIDVVMWIKKPNWELWGAKQQRALVTHGLSHILVTEEGKVKRVGHDVEAFVRETNEFGAWHPELSKLARSLDKVRGGGKPHQLPISNDLIAEVAKEEGYEVTRGEDGSVVIDATKLEELRNRAKDAREGDSE